MPAQASRISDELPQIRVVRAPTARQAISRIAIGCNDAEHPATECTGKVMVHLHRESGRGRADVTAGRS